MFGGAGALLLPLLPVASKRCPEARALPGTRRIVDPLMHIVTARPAMRAIWWSTVGVLLCFWDAVWFQDQVRTSVRRDLYHLDTYTAE
jgi:hypothetical protein